MGEILGLVAAWDFYNSYSSVWNYLVSWHPCIRPSWGVWTWRMHLRLPHFLEMGYGPLAARPTLPLATTPNSLTQDNTLACPVWVKGLDQMLQNIFFPSFQILKLYTKLIAILNQEKLHFNRVLFNLHSGTASNDLGKDRIAKLLGHLCDQPDTCY